MGRLVEQATAAQSPMETMVQRFARVYTPLVLIATACVAFVPWIIGKHDHKVCSNPRRLSESRGV
jgi:cation transport ATPase